MIEIFQWVSTIFFLFGVYFYTSMKASNPKYRIYGFICYEIGGIIYIITCIMLQLYPYVLTQSVFLVLDLRGIINCMREIREND